MPSRRTASLLPVVLAAVTVAQQAAAQPPPEPVLGHLNAELEQTLLTLQRWCSEHRTDATVRQLAWTALAFSANGSDLRVGAFKSGQKECASELRSRQQEDGRITGPDGSFDRASHLLATTAIARMRIESSYTLLQPTTRKGVEAWLAACTQEAPPLGAEEVAVAAVLAEALRHQWLAELEPAVADLVRRSAAKLEPHRSRRDDAVLHLVEVALGAQHPADLTIARCWPGNAADESLPTWLAAWLVRRMPERERSSQLDLLRTLLSARGDDHLWPARGGVDTVTRTALFAGAIGMLSPEPAPRREGAFR